jgi:plasmid stabilization system protein ParE
MAHQIVWSRRAAQDLDSITEYIAADSHAYAGIVLKSIVNQTRILERFPQACRNSNRYLHFSCHPHFDCRAALLVYESSRLCLMFALHACRGSSPLLLTSARDSFSHCR